MGNIFFIIIELIFCFLLVTEGFLWHKKFVEKESLEKREENNEEKQCGKIM